MLPAKPFGFSVAVVVVFVGLVGFFVVADSVADWLLPLKRQRQKYNRPFYSIT